MPGSPLRALEGALRLVVFELTTGYGLYPGRALLILLGMMLLLSFAYLPWIRQQGRTRRPRGAIYRIWPSERLVEDGGAVRLETYGDMPAQERADRLQALGEKRADRAFLLERGDDERDDHTRRTSLRPK